MTARRAKSASELQDELDQLANDYGDLLQAHEELKGNMVFPRIFTGEVIFRMGWLAHYESTNPLTGNGQTIQEAMDGCAVLQALKEST